jgi:hypothetical protein
VGFFETSGAGDAVGAISVGSVDNADYFQSLPASEYSIVNGTRMAFGYAPGTFGDSGNITLNLYATSLDTTAPADACLPLDPATPELSLYLVIIRRGTCSFDTKIANLQAFGARRVLF